MVTLCHAVHGLSGMRRAWVRVGMCAHTACLARAGRVTVFILRRAPAAVHPAASRACVTRSPASGLRARVSKGTCIVRTCVPSLHARRLKPRTVQVPRAARAGNQTAQHHDKVARAWLKNHGTEVPGGLNYLEIDSKAGREYLQVGLRPRPGAWQHGPALSGSAACMQVGACPSSAVRPPKPGGSGSTHCVRVLRHRQAASMPRAVQVMPSPRARPFAGAALAEGVCHDAWRARAQDMAWCQEYAMQNRQAMRRLMEEAVAEVTGAQPDHARAVNIHHNFWRAAPRGAAGLQISV